MRKLMFLFALCMATAMNAQNEDGSFIKRLRIGAEAGVSINNYTSLDRNYREGFFVGARGEYHIKEAYFAASLRLTRKGSDADSGDSDSDDFYEAYYLELPISVGVSGRISRNVHIFGEFGPYVAVGLGGRAKGESYIGNENGMTTYKWDNGFFSKANGSPRSFDAGMSLRGGVDFGHWQIAIGYERGFVPIWSKQKVYYDNSNHYNYSFTLGAAYMF